MNKLLVISVILIQRKSLCRADNSFIPRQDFKRSNHFTVTAFSYVLFYGWRFENIIVAYILRSGAENNQFL